jgi:uncharacterized coiled-coil protein SlyX
LFFLHGGEEIEEEQKRRRRYKMTPKTKRTLRVAAMIITGILGILIAWVILAVIMVTAENGQTSTEQEETAQSEVGQRLQALNDALTASQQDVGRLAEQLEQLKNENARLGEGVTANSNLDQVLGTSGSGFVASSDLSVGMAHVFSLGGPFNDPEMGEIWLPNYNEGRAFVVAPNSPLPRFVYHIDMGELVPAVHPTRTDKDGRHFVVFVKGGEG